MTPATKLHQIERAVQRITETQGRLAVRKRELQHQALDLRLRLSASDAALYEALKGEHRVPRAPGSDEGAGLRGPACEPAHAEPYGGQR